MRQLYLPGRLSAALTGNETALPMLRSMSAGFEDHTRLTDELSMRYGVTLDAVTFLDRLTYFSPFARLTYTIDDSSDLEPDRRPGLVLRARPAHTDRPSRYSLRTRALLCCSSLAAKTKVTVKAHDTTLGKLLGGVLREHGLKCQEFDGRVIVVRAN